MTILKLTDFTNPEAEYIEVCAKLNRLTQRHSIVCEKNKRLAKQVATLKSEILSLRVLTISKNSV